MNKKILFLGLACLAYGQMAVGMQRGYKSAELELIKEISSKVNTFLTQEATDDKIQSSMQSFYNKNLIYPDYTVFEWVNFSAISIIFDFLNDMNLENKKFSEDLFEFLSNLMINCYKKFEKIKEVHIKVNFGFWILMEIRGRLEIFKLVEEKKLLQDFDLRLALIDFEFVTTGCIKKLKAEIAKSPSSTLKVSALLFTLNLPFPEQTTNDRIDFFAMQNSTKETRKVSPSTNDGCTIF